MVSVQMQVIMELLKRFLLLSSTFNGSTEFRHRYWNYLPFSSETAEAILKYLITTIKKFNITSKCIAFSGENANVNFGGLARRGQKNVLSNMKQDLNSDIVGVGCPAHILHNCIQHRADSLQCNVDYTIFKNI